VIVDKYVRAVRSAGRIPPQGKYRALVAPGLNHGARHKTRLVKPAQGKDLVAARTGNFPAEVYYAVF
jgi:hypothetical protein